MDRESAIDSIISKILDGERNLEKLKREASRDGSMIKNPEILARFPKDRITHEIKKLLLKKPTKTLSGVSPIAVMIRPQDSCSHSCIYCPFTGMAAKSYTGLEPAAMRSREHNFDSFLQTSDRVRQFEGAGHSGEKCEVIVMGGTFLEMSARYKRSFIKGIYDGLNSSRSENLEAAMAANERSSHRAVGLTIETRPDVCIPYIDEMLSYGATRVELGVQHPDDDIYRVINRGHTVQDVIDATRHLKNCGFKVLYHIMPGLPGSDPSEDILAIRLIFEDPSFRPDMLKIYPTLVLEDTPLHRMMQKGEFRPYSAEQAADVISEFYRHIPPYVRVMRIQRDIPAQRIESGVRKSNLRELVEKRLHEKKIVPHEIRYREIGLNKKTDLRGFEIHNREYIASDAKETFLSFEDEDGLIAGFARLRLPKESIRSEINSNTALLRELHVYGKSLPISAKPLNAKEGVQHKGLGESLLHEAEEIARCDGRNRMVIISGVGAREYYAKHGYSRLGPYMARDL